MPRSNNIIFDIEAVPAEHHADQVVSRTFVWQPSFTRTMRGPDMVQQIPRVQQMLAAPSQVNEAIERARQDIAKALTKQRIKMREAATVESVQLRSRARQQLYAAHEALRDFDLIELNAICSRIVEDLETSDEYLKQLNGE